MKRTKIVATIGPKSEHPEILKQLSEVGVNVFRLNFSHGSHEEHGKKIDAIRSLKLPGAVMLDTKGPEIRTGEVRDKLFVKIGDKFTMTTEKGVYEDTGKVSVNYKDFLKDVDVNDVICFDSGVMFAKALKKTKTDNENKKKKTQSEINQSNQSITNARNEITVNQNKIEKAKSDIISLNEEIETTRESMKKTMQAYQLADGENVYLEYVFAATSYEELVYRYAIVEQILEYNEEQVEKYVDSTCDAEGSYESVFYCTECNEENYRTEKNKRNTTERLELNKYCPKCRQHTAHKETK